MNKADGGVNRVNSSITSQTSLLWFPIKYRTLANAFFRVLVHLFCFFLSLQAFAQTNDAWVEVITFNTGLGKAGPFHLVGCGKERIPSQIREISRFIDDLPPERPFFILLQEIWDQEVKAEFDRFANERNLFITRTHAKWNGLAIISNQRFFAEQFVPFGVRIPGRDFGILEVKYQLKDGRRIQIANVHTAYSSDLRASPAHIMQLEILAEHMNAKEGPAILGGDLNVGPNLGFRTARYDPVKTIWEPFRENLSEDWQSAPADTTWSEANPLVWKLPFLIWSHNFIIQSLQSPKLKNKGNWPETSSGLDHVFFNGYFERVSSRIIFDEAVEVPGCIYFTQRIRPDITTLSDHFGKHVTLRLISPAD